MEPDITTIADRIAEGGTGEEKPARKPRKPAAAIPTVGRIVHYIPSGNVAARLNTSPGTHCAAIVTAVLTDSYDDSTTVSLYVLSPALNHPLNVSLVHEGTDVHTWHWPEQA